MTASLRSSETELSTLKETLLVLTREHQNLNCAHSTLLTERTAMGEQLALLKKRHAELEKEHKVLTGHWEQVTTELMMEKDAKEKLDLEHEKLFSKYKREISELRTTIADSTAQLAEKHGELGRVSLQLQEEVAKGQKLDSEKRVLEEV